MQFRVVSTYLYLGETEFVSKLTADDKAHLYAYYHQATAGPNVELRRFACFSPLDLWTETQRGLLGVFNAVPFEMPYSAPSSSASSPTKAAPSTPSAASPSSPSSPPPPQVPASSNAAVDWQLWKNLGRMPRIEAASKFIAYVGQVDPDFLDALVPVKLTDKPAALPSLAPQARTRSLPPILFKDVARRLSRVSLSGAVEGTAVLGARKLAVKELIVYEAAACIQALVRGYICKKRAARLRHENLHDAVETFLALLTQGMLVDRVAAGGKGFSAGAPAGALRGSSGDSLGFTNSPTSTARGVSSSNDEHQRPHNGSLPEVAGSVPSSQRCYLKLDARGGMDVAYLVFVDTPGPIDTPQDVALERDRGSERSPSKSGREAPVAAVGSGDGRIYLADVALAVPSMPSRPAAANPDDHPPQHPVQTITLCTSRLFERFSLPHGADGAPLGPSPFTIDQIATLFDVVVDKSLSEKDFRGRGRFFADRLSFSLPPAPPSSKAEATKIVAKLRQGFGVEVYERGIVALKYIWFGNGACDGDGGEPTLVLHVSDHAVAPVVSKGGSVMKRVDSSRTSLAAAASLLPWVSKTMKVSDIVDIREGLVSSAVDAVEGLARSRVDSLLTLVSRAPVDVIPDNAPAGWPADAVTPSSITLSFSSQTFRDEILRNLQRIVSVDRAHGLDLTES